MQEGAFALIDCLGFKGIWRTTKPEIVVSKLKKIDETVRSQLESADYGPFRFQDTSEVKPSLKWFSDRIDPKNVKPDIRLLSDTVAISLQYTGDKKGTDKNLVSVMLVKAMCGVVPRLLDLFLEDEPPLILRGRITYGEHICDRNFIIGPAVDQAAEYMNIPEGGFCLASSNRRSSI